MSKPKGTENLMTRLRREEKPNMSNWTPDQYRDWMTRRLASEQRSRERMQRQPITEAQFQTKIMNPVQDAEPVKRGASRSRPNRERTSPDRSQMTQREADAAMRKWVKNNRNIYSIPVVKAFFKEYGISEPVAEFKFHPTRKFRFDFAWPDHRLGLECQGGLFAKLPGGHNRGAQIRKEHEKRNLAACMGWRILYCEPETLCTKALIDQIRWALGLCPIPDKHIGMAAKL